MSSPSACIVSCSLNSLPSSPRSNSKVQPGYLNAGSPPGASITPSSDTNSVTTIRAGILRSPLRDPVTWAAPPCGPQVHRTRPRPAPELIAGRRPARPWSGLDQDLDRLAVGHRAVAVGHAVEIRRGVEDLPRLDGAVEDVGHQVLDVGADRRGPAGQADVVAEQAAEPDRRLLVLRDADAADDPAWPNDPEGL